MRQLDGGERQVVQLPKWVQPLSPTPELRPPYHIIYVCYVPSYIGVSDGFHVTLCAR